MRCEKCRKEITGIGKPAIPPVIPAIVAWGGAIWAMWLLTLGESRLPSWTPTPGWAVGLTTLVVATTITWYALYRRKCPGCGSRRILQAMEEESLIATERGRAQEQAAGELRAGLEAELRETLAITLRAEIEAELRLVQAKEVADLRTRLEAELRIEIGKQMRAAQVESERGLRQKLTSELRPEIERELRPRLEARLRPEIERELRPRLAEDLRPEIERELRPRLEAKLRPEIEQEWQARMAKAVPVEPDRASPPVLERAPSIGPDKSTTPPFVETTARTAAEDAQAVSSGIETSEARIPPPLPAVPAALRRHSPAGSPAPTIKVASGETAASVKPAEPVVPSIPPKRKALPGFSTPAPATAPSAPGSVAAVADNASTPLPAGPTPPVGAPEVVPPPVAAPVAARTSDLTPAPVGEKTARAAGHGPGTTDVHVRAERRARVIVSDLSLYHKDLLAKAAKATDPRQTLGSLWKDAILAYERAVPADVRGSTNYLENELDKYLTQLREKQAAAI